MADRSIRVRLEAQTQQYKAAMGQAAAATKEFGREISGAGSASRAQMEMVGRTALLMAGGIAVGLGLSVKAAMDWESSWAGVSKTVDGTASQMGALESGLRGLAKELPATHSEIAAVAEAAGQLGIQRESILGFTETMVDLGETTNLSADQAATSMAQFANIMQMSQGDFDRLGSALVELGNNGASTEREIMDLSLRLAGAGKLIGASESDVLAMANAMASLGIEAQLGGGAMSRAMLKIYTSVKEGGDAVQGFADVAGMSAAEFTRAFESDPIRAVDSFIQGLAGIEAGGGNVVEVLSELGIKGTQDLQVLLRLVGAGDLLTDSLEMGADAWDKNSALQDEAAKRYETTAAKLAVLRNNVVDLGISIGDQLLPVLAGAAEGASSMAQGFGAMPGPLKAAATGLAGLSGAGLGVIGLVGTLGPKVREVRDALMSMGSVGQFVGRNLGTIAAAAGGAMAAFAVYTYWLGENAKKQAAAADMAQGFTDAIVEQGAAIGGASDELAASEIMKGDLGEKMRDAEADVALLSRGIQEHAADVAGLEDAYTTWLTKGASQSESLQRALEQTGLAGSEMADELSRLDGAGVPMLTLLQRSSALAEGFQTGAREAENQAAATDAVGDASSSAVDDLNDMGGALGLTGAAAEEAEELIGAFADAIDRLIGQAFDFEEASDALEQAIIDAGQHFSDQAENLGQAGLALDGNSQAALDNREVMRGLIEQGADVIRAAQAQGQSVDALNMIREAEKQKLRELAARYGLTEEQVEGYIAVLDAIPLGVGTTITADDRASGIIDRAKQRLFGIDGMSASVRINIREVWGRVESSIFGRWGMVTEYAKGGIHEFAAGGITPAHIARGDMIRYAEPETGGEAFIPRLGNADRSRAILETAASWYGLAVGPAPGPPMGSGGAGSSARSAGSAGGTTIQQLVLNTPDSPRQWLDEVPWRMAAA